MTHRHRKFWREKETNHIYSRCYCGVDIHIYMIEDGKAWAFERALRDGAIAMLAYAYNPVQDHEVTSMHPDVVMDITAEASTCEECESLFGLKVLGDV